MADTSETFQDHCYLEHLNDATLLHNSKQRFKADLIYTYISEILLVLVSFFTITTSHGTAHGHLSRFVSRRTICVLGRRRRHRFRLDASR